MTEIVIDRPRDEVAAFACDPVNATAWYQNIRAVEWLTDPPLGIGSRVALVGRFLGRQLAYTYEVRELAPGTRFVMSTADGPFPIETTYAWADEPGGATRMTVRNRGEPPRFGSLAAPFISSAIRRANRKDLVRLKRALETRGPAQ